MCRPGSPVKQGSAALGQGIDIALTMKRLALEPCAAVEPLAVTPSGGSGEGPEAGTP